MGQSSSYGRRPTLVTSPVPIGVPFAYPLNQDIPLGYLDCSIAYGTTFAQDIYAELYATLGENVLPYYPKTSTHRYIIKAKESIETIEALKNLETVYVPCMPVGIPFPWVSGQPYPAGTLLLNGQSFDVNEYPELALKYPTGVLPDFRGVALRGRDAGRGLDIDGADRAVGSYQADELKSHKHILGAEVNSGISGGRFGSGETGISSTSYYVTNTSGTSTLGDNTSSTGGTETRMKNVAVDWLVFAKTMAYDLTVGNGNAVTLGGYAPSYFTPLARFPELVKANMNAQGLAPMGACRAWVNFNGTGTVTIKGSMNVSSIADNGTGDYTVNFATAMPDTNYSEIMNANSELGGTAVTGTVYVDGTTKLPLIKTVSALRIRFVAADSICYDRADLSLAVFR